MKVKRLLAIILVLLMSLSLFACGDSSGGDDAQNSPSGTEDKTPGPTSEVKPGSTVGYMTDDVDHFSRDPYTFAYMCNDLGWVFNRAIADNLKKLGEYFNYELLEYACMSNFDAYINQIMTYANNGIDGLILGTDDALVTRAFEVCEEYNIPCMAESTAFVDLNGTIVGASVVQDQYGNGALCMEWLAEHYSDYWDTDLSDSSAVGLIPITFSGVTGINDRVPGITDAFKEAFPNSADNIFVADLVSVGFSVQGAYDLVSSQITSTDGIEKWLIVACVDDWATGATRAVESVGMEDDVLITCVQGNAFVNEMNSGYTGSTWVSCCYIPEKDFSENMAAGLVALVDGRATLDTLWPEDVPDGAKAPCKEIQGTMVTKDTYEEFLETQVITFD